MTPITSHYVRCLSHNRTLDDLVVIRVGGDDSEGIGDGYQAREIAYLSNRSASPFRSVLKLDA
ncbi:MAG TPA: hypothetical protein VE268_12440 [Herpetosiphonaceae bacterium]|nr:hypothetical protein [Herpetosiphonaceae bacterium]